MGDKMEQNNKSPEYNSIMQRVMEDPILNKVAKGVIAWAMLILVGSIVWKMAEPVLPKKAGINTAKEATETASSPGANIVASEKEKPKKESGDLTLPSGTNRVQVTASAVNVRAEPDLKSDKVTTLSRGTIVQVVDESSQWIKIRTAQGDVGYIKKSPELIRAAP